MDAKPSELIKALKKNWSLGIAPGGIAEMFWGYPKPGCKPNEEYAFLKSRKGFLRMAMRQGTPVVPVYCFGNSHAMHKAKTPWVLEALSRSVSRPSRARGECRVGVQGGRGDRRG